MDSRLLLGIGVSALSLFLRWRFPAAPKPVATAGAIMGLALIAWSFWVELPWFYAVPAIVGAALVAAAADLLITRKAPVAESAAAAPPISIDQSVTSHGQSGGITAHSVINQAPEPDLAVGKLSGR